MNWEHRKTAQGRIIAGAMLLGIGLALLLAQLGVLRAADLGDLWPLIVITLGLARLLGSSDPKSRKGGYVLLFLGAWFLTNTLHIGGLDWGTSWPLALVAIGLAKVLAGSAIERGSGFFLVILGTLLQLLVTGAFGFELQYTWPLLIVLAGLWTILRAFAPRRRAVTGTEDNHEAQ